MNDTYIELLVKKPNSKAASLLHTFMIVVGAVLFLGGFFFLHYSYFYIPLFGIVLMVCSFIPSLFNDIEYEYLFLNKELTIDRIRKQEHRKTIATYKLESLEIMAPKGSGRMARYDRLKVCDYTSRAEESNPYEIVVDGNGEKVRVIIDTTEEVLNMMRKAYPRSVYND